MNLYLAKQLVFPAFEISDFITKFVMNELLKGVELSGTLSSHISLIAQRQNYVFRKAQIDVKQNK